MIYYFPERLFDQHDRASSKRPYEIFSFLKEREQEDDFVVGRGIERYRASLKLIRKIRKGYRPDSIYIESLNMPFYLHEIRRFSFFWLADLFLFFTLKRAGVKFMLFYRDMYWRFPEFKKSSFAWKLKGVFHRIEWTFISRYIDLLLLPTESIGDYLPQGKRNFKTLAFHPGLARDALDKRIVRQRDEGSRIRLLYIGGVLPPFYRLNFALEIVQTLEHLELTICCREHEWEKVKDDYRNYSFDRVKIVHKSGDELFELYADHDVFVDLRLPEGYYKHAFPYKYIETVSFDMPLIIFRGGSAGPFVEDNGFGWVVDSVDEAIDLFRSMTGTDIQDKQDQIARRKSEFGWGKRFEFLNTYLDSHIK